VVVACTGSAVADAAGASVGCWVAAGWAWQAVNSTTKINWMTCVSKLVRDLGEEVITDFLFLSECENTRAQLRGEGSIFISHLCIY
jgi:glycerol uptake facilitator-like aquaporin